MGNMGEDLNRWIEAKLHWNICSVLGTMALWINFNFS